MAMAMASIIDVSSGYATGDVAERQSVPSRGPRLSPPSSRPGASGEARVERSLAAGPKRPGACAAELGVVRAGGLMRADAHARCDTPGVRRSARRVAYGVCDLVPASGPPGPTDLRFRSCPNNMRLSE